MCIGGCFHRTGLQWCGSGKKQLMRHNIHGHAQGQIEGRGIECCMMSQLLYNDALQDKQQQGTRHASCNAVIP